MLACRLAFIWGKLGRAKYNGHSPSLLPCLKAHHQLLLIGRPTEKVDWLTTAFFQGKCRYCVALNGSLPLINLFNNAPSGCGESESVSLFYLNLIEQILLRWAKWSLNEPTNRQSVVIQPAGSHTERETVFEIKVVDCWLADWGGWLSSCRRGEVRTSKNSKLYINSLTHSFMQDERGSMRVKAKLFRSRQSSLKSTGPFIQWMMTKELIWVRERSSLNASYWSLSPWLTCCGTFTAVFPRQLRFRRLRTKGIEEYLRTRCKCIRWYLFRVMKWMFCSVISLVTWIGRRGNERW